MDTKKHFTAYDKFVGTVVNHVEFLGIIAAVAVAVTAFWTAYASPAIRIFAPFSYAAIAIFVFMALLGIFAVVIRIRPPRLERPSRSIFSTFNTRLEAQPISRDVRLNLIHLLTWAANRIGVKVILAVLSEMPKAQKELPPADAKKRGDLIMEMNRWLAAVDAQVLGMPYSDHLKTYVLIHLRAETDKLKKIPPERIAPMNAFEFGEFYLKVAECEAAAVQLTYMTQMLDKSELQSFGQIRSQLDERKRIN